MPPSLPCDTCSLRRVKCDGKNPCSKCLARTEPCTYLKIRKRRGPKGPRKSSRAKIHAVQKDLGVVASSQRAFSPACGERAEFFKQPARSMCRHIALSTYCTYIDIFQTRLYTVWPIVSVNSLKARLSGTNIIDPDANALAAALCAATIAQLRLPAHKNPANHSLSVSSEDFVRECLRFRSSFGYQDNATLDSLLTSIFLHMYYANVDRISQATFALRDAITYAHILNLGSRQTLDSLQPQQRQHRLRIYWILLVTERTFCMQHNNTPIILQTIDYLPSPLEDGDSGPSLLTGFCNLVGLFTSIDGPLIQTPHLTAISLGSTYSRERIKEIQEGLQNGVTNPIIDEIQRVDIWITLAWLSSLLWQYSASNFMLTSEETDAFFAPNFPFVIAKDFLSLACRASIDSVRPHGYGMEIKLFQLANSLVDVLIYVPSLGKSCGTSDWGPRQAVVELERLLDLVAGGESERLDTLHTRMSQMDFTPAPRQGLLGAQRGETPEIPKVAHLADDELPATDETDETSSSQSGFPGYDQTISDEASVITDQEINRILDLEVMVGPIGNQQVQEDGSDDGSRASLEYMAAIDFASQPLSIPEMPRPGENRQIPTLDLQQIFS